MNLPWRVSRKVYTFLCRGLHISCRFILENIVKRYTFLNTTFSNYWWKITSDFLKLNLHLATFLDTEFVGSFWFSMYIITLFTNSAVLFLSLQSLHVLILFLILLNLLGTVHNCTIEHNAEQEQWMWVYLTCFWLNWEFLGILMFQVKYDICIFLLDNFYQVKEISF